MYLSKLTGCTTSRVNCDVNYGLGAVMLCRFRLTRCGKCTAPVGGGDNAVICGETGGYWNAVFFAKLYSEPKTALNKKKEEEDLYF